MNIYLHNYNFIRWVYSLECIFLFKLYIFIMYCKLC